MLSRSGIKVIAVTVLFGTAVAGCSEIYYDRRESVALSAGDAVATNKVTQMVDPWPRHSANNRLAFDGERMQAAAQRHRQGKSITPVNVTTSSAAYQQAQQAAAATATATGQATSAAPVRGP